MTPPKATSESSSTDVCDSDERTGPWRKGKSPRSRWRQIGTLAACATMIALVAVAFWARRDALLRSAARALIWDDGPVRAGYLWIPSSEADANCDPRYLDLIAKACKAEPARRVLVVEPARGRLVRTGVVPTFETMMRTELARRGVSDTAVVVVPGRARGYWEECRALGAWLDKHADASVCLVCDRFRSGSRRRVLEYVLPAGQSRQVRSFSVPHYAYDENGWWEDRTGIKDFMTAWLSRVYIECHGEDSIPDDAWNPDDYERSLVPHEDRIVCVHD